MTKHENSEFIQHEPCPSCGSKDNLARYDDGHGFCFGCGHIDRVSDNISDISSVRDVQKTRRSEYFNGEYASISKRNLSEDTCRKFGYQVGTDKSGQPVHIANYYDEKNAVVAQKIRWKDKKFIFIGETDKVGLYGQHLWRDKGRKVVVTEGEIDCLSVSQAQGNKYPVVSIPTGVKGAKKILKQELEWLEGFDEVILMFDNDEVGIEAAKDCAQLFSPSKCKIAKLPAKDASELLADNRVKDIIEGVWGATSYRPDGVICGDELKDEIDKPIEWGLSYPYDRLTTLTFGIRPNEIITLGAGTGMGKTELWKEIATHIGVEHKQNVGMVFLEEQITDTALGIMGKHSSIPFHLPDTQYTEEDKNKAFNETLKTGRFFFYDHFGYMDYNSIKSRLRYLVVSCGCKYLFLDHITALVTGHDGDERRELDRIMTDLASMVRELKFTLFLISHLSTPDGKPHEEGGRVMLKHFRGSRAIGQWSSFVVGLERNQQDVDTEARHTTTLRILKDRYTGRSTGECLYLGYSPETGRLTPKDNCPFQDETGGESNVIF